MWIPSLHTKVKLSKSQLSTSAVTVISVPGQTSAPDIETLTTIGSCTLTVNGADVATQPLSLKATTSKVYG